MTSDSPFPRQPQPVKVHVVGEDLDVVTYITRIRSYLERNSYDTVSRTGFNTFTIYPGAIND